jgi:hypothetical protein
MSAFRLPSEAYTSTDQEVAEQLLETHFPGSQPISATIAISANDSINRGQADCIVWDHRGENKMGNQWIIKKQLVRTEFFLARN